MQKLLAQIMKFGVVGVIATVIDFGIMNLLHYGLGLNILIANTSGFIISLIFNYLASMKYVFAHKEGMSRRREFIIFVVLSVIGLVLNDGIVLALNAGLGLEANIAKICATARSSWRATRPSSSQPYSLTMPTDNACSAQYRPWALFVYGQIFNVCGLALENLASSYSSCQRPYVSHAKALKYLVARFINALDVITCVRHWHNLIPSNSSSLLSWVLSPLASTGACSLRSSSCFTSTF